MEAWGTELVVASSGFCLCNLGGWLGVQIPLAVCGYISAQPRLEQTSGISCFAIETKEGMDWVTGGEGELVTMKSKDFLTQLRIAQL